MQFVLVPRQDLQFALQIEQVVPVKYFPTTQLVQLVETTEQVAQLELQALHRPESRYLPAKQGL